MHRNTPEVIFCSGVHAAVGASGSAPVHVQSLGGTGRSTAVTCRNCSSRVSIEGREQLTLRRPDFVQVGAVQKFSSPDPVAGFLQRASLDLGLPAGSHFAQVQLRPGFLSIGSFTAYET